MSINRILLNRMVVSGNSPHIKLLRKRSINPLGSFLAFVGLIFSGEALAHIVSYSDVVASYSDCTFQITGFNYVYGITLNFNAATQARIDYSTFQSRGYLLMAYNANGTPINSEDIADSALDGKSNDQLYGDDNYVLYFSQGGQGGVNWSKANAFSARLVMKIPIARISTWPAIGVRAANVLTTRGGLSVADEKGWIYIGPSTKGGNCPHYSNPTDPPPAVFPKVTMTAPDWNLGELPAGEETVLALPATKDQLCFNYEGVTALTSQRYLINATNSNGLSANGRYLLKSLEDSSQTVPYTLTLKSSTDAVFLPNTLNRLFSLDAGGRTCFTPTFNAQPDKTVKAGAYSDILTFTVVAKP
ncbi:hypothetical protein SAMN04489800_3808 [Pseudomonas deceptionensis]|uniref:Uncharacterized protein n=1 Tax=Pseudomonas deceptionensis TaxID=882211 RepID=A0A1H5NPP7_PSEDM|nr:hypothetical protein SAMN04489800_3808 [Pseudomonas deceptionensis]